ncbi:MAG: metallophosphoesterase [Methanothrix sp.]|nr:metallophosphoesterase [Methanothrix sp.]
MSDLHFGKSNRFGQMDHNELAKRFYLGIEDAKKELSTEAKIDFVIITGDIADTAIPAEYKQAESFLSYLSDELKLDRLRFVFIPGNHDISWPYCEQGVIEQKIHGFGEDELRSRMDKYKFNTFKQFLRDFYGKDLTEVAHMLDNDALIYNFEDVKVSIAALNSCELESHRDDDHNGQISKKQAQAAMDFWNNDNKYSDWIKVVAFHHNLKPVKEDELNEWSEYLKSQKGKGELSAEDVLRHKSDLFGLIGREYIEMLAKDCQVQLVLHGHQHSSKEDSIPRTNGKGHIEILSAGSFGLDTKKLPKDQRNSIRLILLDIDKEKMLTAIRIYDRMAPAPGFVESGYFVQDTSRKEIYEQDLLLPINYKPNKAIVGAVKSPRRSTEAGFLSFTDYAESIRNFIDDYLGRPGQPIPFGGRDEELKAFDAWLDSSDSPPYLLLAAPAGRGKSALLVRWKQRLESRMDIAVVFVPVSIRRGTNLSSVVFTALASQLARLHGEMPPDPNATSPVLQGIIQHFLARPLPDGRRLVVILDGIDEAADWKAGPDLFPPNPNDDLKIAVSARYIADCSDAGSWLRKLGWDRPGMACTPELTKLSIDGIADVLHQMGFPLADLSRDVDIKKELYRLSEYGDPLLVKLYVEDLWTRGEKAARLMPEDLKTIKKGYDGYFENWWEHQKKLWDKQCEMRRTVAPTSEPIVWEVLNIFACARGPLSLNDIRKLMPPKMDAGTWKINETLRLLERFIIGDGRNQGYIFGHPKLGQYFKEKMANSERLSIESRFIEYGKETLRALNDGTISPDAAPHYVVRYYSSHLVDQDGNDQLIFDLVSKGWMQSWFAHEGAYSGFLNDVERAWQAALKANKKEIAAGRNARYVGNIILYALCLASVNSLSGNISSELLFLLVENGVFGLSQGLAYARQKPDLLDRAVSLSILSQIDENRKEEIFNEALEIAREIKDDWLKPRALASKLMDDRLDRLKSRALADLTSKLSDSRSQELLKEALEIDYEIEEYILKSKAVAEVASKFDDSRKSESLKEALETVREIKDDWLKPMALADVASKLEDSQSPELLKDVLEIAREIKDEGLKSRALAGIASRLDDSRRPELLKEALEIAREIKDDWSKSMALAGVAAKLADSRSPELLKEALEVASAIKDVWPRSGALADVACKFADNRSPELLKEALEIAREIKDEGLKSRALADVASKFDDSRRPELLKEALEIAREIKNAELKSRALADVSSKFDDSRRPELLKEALEIAREIKDDWLKSRALADVVSKLADSRSLELLKEALEIAREIKDKGLKSSALAEIASKLADSRSPELLKEALEIAREIKDDWLRSSALADVASKFEDSRKPELLKEAAEIAHEVKNDWLKSSALANVASKLADGQSLELLNEALEIAREIKDDRLKSSALAKAASKFDDCRRPELLKEAIEIAREIKDEWQRSIALACVATKFDDFRRPELLEETLKVAREIVNAVDRSEALARISPLIADYSPKELYDPWCETVRLSVSRTRAATIADLQALIPIIISLGGQEALKSFADSIIIVGQWWP